MDWTIYRLYYTTTSGSLSTSSIATKISSSLAEQVTPTIQSGKPW